MIKLNQLTKLSAQKRKRIGRGSSSGTGTTAGRGTKGQKSRSGAKIPSRFQGGSLPLWQRLPKKDGIKSKKIKPKIVKINKIESCFENNQLINFNLLIEKKLISEKDLDKFGLKIIGRPQEQNKFQLEDNILFSKNLTNVFQEQDKVNLDINKKE